MGVHLEPKPLTFRRKQNHPLSKLLREISKETPEAVKKLVDLMDSENEKIALGAASKLVDMQIDIANAIEKDDITRTLAEIKLNGPQQLGEVDDEDDTPKIDFTTIQDV